MTRTEVAYHALIDSYLQGGLQGEALESFRQRLITDSQLAHDVELHQTANALVADYGLLQVKAKLQNIHAKHQAAKLKTKTWKNIAAGSVVAGALVLGTFWYTSPEAKQAEPYTPGSDIAPNTSVTQKADQSPMASNPQKSIPIPISKTPVVQPATPLEDNSHEWTDSQPVEQIPANNEQEKEASVLENRSTGLIIQGTTAPQVELSKPSPRTLPQSNPAESKPLTTTDPCEDVQITFDIDDRVDPVYAGRPSGSFKIEQENILGGTPPYQFSNDGGLTFQSNAQFDRLLGNQENHVMVKDASGCKSDTEILMLYPENETALSFRPLQGESWEIPVLPTDNGTIRIMSPRGEVYRTRLNNGYPNTWNGRGTNGNFVDDGAYIWTIQLDDGSMVNGEITVIR